MLAVLAGALRRPPRMAELGRSYEDEGDDTRDLLLGDREYDARRAAAVVAAMTT